MMPTALVVMLIFFFVNVTYVVKHVVACYYYMHTTITYIVMISSRISYRKSPTLVA